MVEEDNLIGPGTDLVISLLVIALLLVSALTQLYADTINDYEQVKANEIRLVEENQEMGRLKEQLLLTHTELLQAQSEIKISEGINTTPIDEQLESKPKLDEGHKQEVPKRTTKGKMIFRVYVEGNPRDPYFLMKPPNTDKKIPAAPLTIHTELFNAQKRYQSSLYVAVLVPESFPGSQIKKYQCEFWEYDYYQYFDQAYCQR